MSSTSKMNIIAKHETDGVMFAANYKEGKVFCYECNEQLSFVPQHVRNGSNVVAYFRHLTRSQCGGEGVEHKVAKQLLVKYSDVIKFNVVCPCKSSVPHTLEGDYIEEVSWRDYRFDIGVKQKDTIVGAVEVCHSHAIQSEKVRALNESNIVWYEVSAKSIIDACRVKQYVIPVLRTKESRCPDCLYISPIMKERLIYLHSITEMTNIPSPLYRYYKKMVQCSNEILRELEINRNELHIWFASIHNRMKPLLKGKFKGYTVDTVYLIAPDYVRWIAIKSTEFPEEIVLRARRLLNL